MRAILTALAFVWALSQGPTRAAAQADFTHAYQTWAQVFFQGPLHGSLWLQADLQYRGHDDFSPVGTIVRAALAHRTAEGMMFGLGYSWQPLWRQRGGEGFVDEHRVFLNWQWELVHRETGIRFLMRARMEERLRRPASTLEVGLRVRQWLRLAIPVDTDRRLFVIAYDEFMTHMLDAGRTPDGVDEMGEETFTALWSAFGYDQNRLFVGMGYQFVPSVLRIELGYLNQWVRRPNNPAGDAMNHVLVLNTVVNWN